MQQEKTLAELKEDLEDVKHAIYCMRMSDDYCYTNGRIKPLQDREDRIRRQIRELEAQNGK